MEVDIKVPANYVKESITYWCEVETGKRKRFPLFTIDRDSYIITGKIKSRLREGYTDIYNIQIGRHTAIGANVLFHINLNHDYRAVHQGIISAIESGNEIPKKILRKGQIIIQNDCWLGENVTIKSGVTIHNGATVANHSVVTKDVPPYAIVGGNPAKIIGWRFSEDIIKKKLSISWWNWTTEEMIERKEDIGGSVEEFVNKYYVEQKEEEHSVVNRMTTGKAFVYFLDMDEDYPLYEEVIAQYIRRFEHTDSELILYLNPKSENFESNSIKLLEFLGEFEDKECYINICSEEVWDESLILVGADYYISNREAGNIKRMCEAERRGIICLSGVDSDIFAVKNN